MNRYPYTLVAVFTHGHEVPVKSGHCPVEVREAERRVARNPQAIKRIELRDLDGCLETIWANDWEKLSGINP